jgi:hypothetical protein
MAQLMPDNSIDADVQKDDLCESLRLAMTHGHLKVAELLVQRGTSVDPNESPLYRAAENDTVALKLVCLLINHDSNGWTPLYTASYGRKTKGSVSGRCSTAHCRGE